MKRTLTALLLISLVVVSTDTFSQTTGDKPKKDTTYTKPAWTIGVGGVWNLATNDAYGRANYSSQDQVLRDNFGMRWGWGAFVNLKFSPGNDLGKVNAKRQNRIYLGFDYKGMTNSDFESGANKTSYDIITIGA
mgnify:CR=1 FL=1